MDRLGVYGLEWTPRFGLDAICCLMRLVHGSIGELFFDLVNNRSERMEIENKFCGGVRLTIPSYPYEPEEDEPIPMHPGIPLQGLDVKKKKDMYFYEIMRGNKPNEIVHSGGVGLIMCAMSVSDDFHTCLDGAYKICEDARIPDKMYRTDLREVLEKDYDELVRLGE